MPKLIILPGTDGTGLMLRPFIEALGPNADVVVLDYPTHQSLGYSELERIIRPLLPTSEPYVLLGESFGGPLAISIAASQPVGLVGLVLSASFARYPVAWLRPFAPLARLAPVRAAPSWLLSWLLLGRWSTPALRAMLQAAVRAVSPNVLRSRVMASLRVDASQSLGHVRVPLLYLRASRDRVVGRRASADLLRWSPHATVAELSGPHFLLQAEPQACSQVVQRFAAGL